MTFTYAADLIHNIRSQACSIIPEKPRYPASFAITTIALTALSFYAPVSLFLAGIALTAVHVECFNKAIRQLDPSSHPIIQHWMAVACLVSSAFIVVHISYFLPCLSWGMQALQTLDLSSALLYFTYFTGAIGYGGEVAKKLYERGEELASQSEWAPMKALMQSKHSYSHLSCFSRWKFAIGLIKPEWFANTTSLGGVLLFPFIPPAEQEGKLNELIETYTNTHHHDPNYLVQQDRIFNCLAVLSTERQLALLAKIASALETTTPLIVKRLSSPVQRAFRAEQSRLSQLNPLPDYKKRQEALYADIEQPLAKDQLNAISQRLVQLRSEIQTHRTALIQYGLEPNREFTSLLVQLSSDAPIQQLEQLNSTIDANSGFDPTLPSYEYFFQADPAGGINFVNSWAQYLDIPPNDPNALDHKLAKLEIAEIGSFIDKVLGGDKSHLKDPTVVLNHLRAFIKSKEENTTRDRLYSFLAGRVTTHTSFLSAAAGKAAYRLSMMLTAVAPIIIYPKLTAVGFGLRTVYAIPPLQRRVDNLISYFFLNHFSFIYHLITRRSFFSLLSQTSEMSTYAKSNTFSKMRILAFEFCMGFFLANASFDNQGEIKGLGGIITGWALAQEISDTISRIWRARVRAV